MSDRKLLNIELGRISAEEYRSGRTPSGIVLVLDNVRSAHNTGSAFRTADAFGVDKVYLGGITPVPPSPELRKVALGAEEVVPSEHVADVVSLVHRLKAEGYTVIAVEQTEHSVKLNEFQKEIAGQAGNDGTGKIASQAGNDGTGKIAGQAGNDVFVIPSEASVSRAGSPVIPGSDPESPRYALVFGNEVAGVQQEVVDACDFALEIPQKGTKHSLNVSVSIGVVLWAISARS